MHSPKEPISEQIVLLVIIEAMHVSDNRAPCQSSITAAYLQEKEATILANKRTAISDGHTRVVQEVG